MQPELFQDLPAGQRPKRSAWGAFPGRHLQIRVAYEDLIFGVLGVLLLLLGGFCLGVERGKRLTGGRGSAVSVHAPRAPEPELPSQVVGSEPGPVLMPAVPAVRPAPIAPARKSKAVSVAAREPQGRYVIQLASYVGPQSARNEAERLRRKGVDARVVKSGRYYELRAIGYRSHLEAKSSLERLRKRYRDAFVKRLSAR